MASLLAKAHTMQRLIFNLPLQLAEAIRQLARNNHRTLTAELILAVENHLKASKAEEKTDEQ